MRALSRFTPAASFFYITYAPKRRLFFEIRDEQCDEHLQALGSAGYEIELIDRAN